MLTLFVISAIVSGAIMIFCGIMNLFDLEYYVPIIDTHDTGWYALVAFIFSVVAVIATAIINISLNHL